MKKVFRIWKYVQSMADVLKKSPDTLGAFLVSLSNEQWARECEGKTKEECYALGYGLSPIRLVEEVSE